MHGMPLAICLNTINPDNVKNDLDENTAKQWTSLCQSYNITPKITPENLVFVGVRDTGAGIAPHVQEVVFERFRQATSFVTREHGGTGLGLALVREFIKLMGGELRLTSQLGLGSYFECSVPELNQAARAANLDH